jgi:hypothetical protein
MGWEKITKERFGRHWNRFNPKLPLHFCVKCSHHVRFSRLYVYTFMSDVFCVFGGWVDSFCKWNSRWINRNKCVNWQNPGFFSTCQATNRITYEKVIILCFVGNCLYFFFWPMRCLFFFHIQILITTLISSNSSYIWKSIATK